jgi:hypothetical protein
MEAFRSERHMLQARLLFFRSDGVALCQAHRLHQHILKFLDRESVDLFHGDTFKASEVARLLLVQCTV